MAGPAKTIDQNILPVQAYFDVFGNFQTFIGQGQPFTVPINPIQSGLTITNSTLDSSPIGATTPSTGVFTNVATTTGTITTTPSGNTDIANKYYVDTVAQGLGPKAACQVATTANITLSGLQTIDGYTTLAGDRVLVKNQSTSSQNGIYIASATAWARSSDMNAWSEFAGAYTVVLSGGQADTGWVCTASSTGTIGTTPVPWVQFAGNGTYYNGTGLSLSSNTFSITNTGVTAGTYGSSSQTVTLAINAQGQVTSASQQNIAIAATQITSGTISTSLISGSYTGITGVGTLTAGTWNGSTIAVAYGGTGATTLTGYVYGNGTGAMTASTTIPNTAISGLGTMSTQNANSVSITGGSISGLSSPLAVASGGSGANTLTGYVYGNGTGAMTASTTIPSTAITGLGTMATQNANSVAITGGTINNTSIGATTRSSGDFTTLSGNTVTNTTPVLSFNASNTIASFGSTTSGSYNQLVIQNLSNSANASANYVISNNLGTDSSYYGEFGMNSSTFSSGTPSDFWSINNGVYFSGHDGDIAVGSGNGYKLYFPWGATPNNAHVINASGALGFSTNLGSSPSTTGTTGYGTSGQPLISGGSSAAPSWGTLGISGGGTNSTATPTAGGAVYGTGTAYAITAAGTSGQFLQSNGASAPTWANVSGSISITDDTTTNATRYLTFTSVTSGSITTEYTSSTKLQFNPSTGVLTAISFNGTATNATNIAVTDNTSTNANYYPVFVSSNSGNNAATTSSTKLKYNPSTGALYVSAIYIAP